jgi:hypothetical protein
LITALSVGRLADAIETGPIDFAVMEETSAIPESMTPSLERVNVFMPGPYIKFIPATTTQADRSPHPDEVDAMPAWRESEPVIISADEAFAATTAMAQAGAPQADEEVTGNAAQAAAASGDDKIVAFGGEPLIAAADSVLENTRGGFDPGNGLMVSFGITRVAYVNGSLATTTSFNIGDVSKMTPQQADMLSKQIGTVNLVQNGAGNSFDPAFASSGTVIQNTLNNQTIVTKTVIDATANSSGLLRNLNMQRTLTEALSGGLRR